MAEDLAKTAGKDHVRLEYVPQDNGGSIRLSAEEGVLQLLGNALKNAQASGAIPGFGP
jgi:heterodisulfide reductase subunit B